MKSAIPILTFALLCTLSCVDKKEVVEENSLFLSPEIMCGTVVFTDGCSPEIDSLIRFGLALVHHMTYEDAAYHFDRVIQKDPDCFWGHWGKAMTYIHPLWPDVPSEKEMETGYTLSQRALALAKNDKEKSYAEVIAAFYAKSEKNKAERLKDMQQGWANAHQAFPDDPEAELFNGLFRLSITPPTDKTYAVQTEVGAMAERILEKYPDHPGGFHYGIHAYDVPPLANKAIELARNYGKLAPEVPHALHMPSHIFTRLGYWNESIDWNSRSAVAAARLPYGKEVSPHMFHALDYKVYALLQFGEDAKAEEIKHLFDTISAPINVNPAAAYALAATPSRIQLEQHDWAGAAQLADPDTAKFPWKKFPQYEALFYFAKGIGSARNGDAAGAQTALDKLNALQAGLGDSPQTKYWSDQIEAQKGCVAAWQAMANGNTAEAIKLMNAAADLEDGTQKNPVSPGSLLPARELLGDMLMETNQYADALAAYEKSLTNNPNRYNTYFGAGMAAEKMKDMNKARMYYQKLVDLKGETASTRESLAHAKAMLASS
jgi:tetratricopeptide (TPR) repeat protein